ncbi:MAG: glycosyltransferase family 4 protein [Bacteroidales bacterium]|nr:glycosyltransferase family 4 protein [Bacteroidales bacterium]
MKVYYIDPQSYNNLSLYDYSLLQHISKDDELIYYYSDMYQLTVFPPADCRCRFHYSQKKGLAKAFSYVRSIWGIFRDAWREKPDVVHVQWIRLWLVDYLFAWLLQRRGIRIVHTAHNLLPHVRYRGDAWQYRKYYQLSDALIVHNECTRDEMMATMHIDAQKIHVIRHGMLESLIPEAEVLPRGKQLRKDFGIGENVILFCSLGVQKPYKGTQEVVEAWGQHPELHDNPACHLLIAGRNHGLDYTSLASCKNVTILDEMLTDLDFEAWLSQTQVLLLPYRRISQSGLIFSAVHRRTPVLVTSVGGLSEILQIGRIGWNIGRLEDNRLGQEMVRLVSHPEEIAQMQQREAEFQKIESAFSWTHIGEETSALYSEI